MLAVLALRERPRRMRAVLAAVIFLRPYLIGPDIGPQQISVLLRQSGAHKTRYP
jgi:hypothetical protein